MLDLASTREIDQELQALYPEKEAVFVSVNVKDRAQVEKAFETVIEKFGTVDIVINGAGILSEKNVENVIGVNLLGVINGTEVALQHMAVDKGGRGGAIFNIASVLGLDTHCNVPVYTATKHAVVGYTTALASKHLESTLGVKFVVICPGFTLTSLLENMQESVWREELIGVTKTFFDVNGYQR